MKRILSFDCATRTLGYALVECRNIADNFGEDAANVRAWIDDRTLATRQSLPKDCLSLYKLHNCGVIDVTAGRLIRNVSANRRRLMLIAALGRLIESLFHAENGGAQGSTCALRPGDVVLLEDQPAKLNKGSRLVQEQIAMYFAMRPELGLKIKTIAPWRKLQCAFARAMCGAIKKEGCVAGKSNKYKDKRAAYARNKRYSVDVLSRALVRGVVSGGGIGAASPAAMLYKWPAAVHDDIADAFLQAVAWAEDTHYSPFLRLNEDL
jgi:hypothetical protein